MFLDFEKLIQILRDCQTALILTILLFTTSSCPKKEEFDETLNMLITDFLLEGLLPGNVGTTSESRAKHAPSDIDNFISICR